MAGVPLTEGSLRIIMRGGDVTDPIMQVLSIKRITSNSDKERYRMLLSDGKNFISFAMFARQANDPNDPGELIANSIIKIKRYVTSVINNTGKANNKRVLVILETETLVSGDRIDKIGDPEPLPGDDLQSTTNGSTSNESKSNEASLMPVVRPTPSFRQTDSSASLQDQLIHPIASLSPYQNKWVVRARVTNKSGIRKWSNSRGEGQLFSVDLIDESGEIRAIAFRDLVDKFYDLFEVDKVYYISKCMLKVANKQFSNIKNDYEMTLINETIVQECHDDGSSVIPKTQYDFIPISTISSMEVGACVDIIGVCKEASDVQTFQARSTGRELRKRQLTVVDKSRSGISLTLWGNDAENFDGSSQPVVAVKRAKIGEFGGGKNVSLAGGSVMKINPDIPESHQLRGWFDNEGKDENISDISAKTGAGGFTTPWMTFNEAQDQNVVHAEKGDYFQAKGTVLLYRVENAFYKACPTDGCNKKIVDLENGMYRCEKCNREYPNFKYRLLGSMNVADWSGSTWVSMFASEAEKILGQTSQEIGEASERDPGALANIIDKANFKQFMLRCRAKVENFNDESRLKIVVMKAEPVNYKEYNKHLISKIQELANL